MVREDITLGVVLTPQLQPVTIDPAQLEQVILNLVVNARDAMPNGGRLTIHTYLTHVTEKRPTDSGEFRPGLYSVLAVRDTGVGMSAETKARIFEPFFTTKPPGIGTGLGLATVYGSVKQAGGHIEVESELGQGTEFRVFFPVTEKSTTALAVSPAEPVGRGKETVLLVEDEPLVLNLARIVLESHGYTVLACSNGAAALKAAEAQSGPIHLLLTDVIMPSMGGRELAERLLRSRPDVRVVFMSGYTDDDVLRQGIGGAVVEYIQKPFTPLALAKRVRGILDGHSAAGRH